MFYSGIDLHKDMCWIATIDELGCLARQSKLPNDPPVILDYFQKLGPTHQAVVESTSNWYWLSDLLREHHIPLVLAHAKYIKAISYAKVKTDKVDSLTLAQLLRMDLIPSAHQISPELRGLRDLMRARLNLVHKKISAVNSIHRLHEKFNLQTPRNLDHIQDNAFSSEYQFQMKCHVEQIKLLNTQIRNLEKSLHPKLIPNPDIQRLLSVPGIGKISAFTLYLEIDGITRFPQDKNFFSYARLVPGANNSNQKIRHKSGSKDGNKYLKIAFTEITVQAIKNYPVIKRFYNRKLRHSNKAIARTIVAKEIAKIVYHILLEQSEFKTFKGIPIKKSVQWPRLTNPGA